VLSSFCDLDRPSSHRYTGLYIPSKLTRQTQLIINKTIPPPYISSITPSTMRMSRNLQDGGPGRQNMGSNYRQGPPPPGYRSRNLQDGGPGFQGPSPAEQRRQQQEQRRMEEMEHRRRMQEEEARYRQRLREEREYRERMQREEDMRRREEAMFRRNGGGGGGGRQGPPPPGFRTRNVQDGGPGFYENGQMRQNRRRW
jgi:hypothetical protein